MTLPDFLVIGAMKAGTTTLFRDLREHPDIFMPADKELHCLVDDDVLTEAGRAAYERAFAHARPGQRCGEASTGYTKLPDVTGVPERAEAVLGSDLRLIYVVRHPVARIVSHYHHDYNYGQVALDIDAAVREYPPLLNYSRYAMQVTPWIERFGAGQVRIVRFEDFVADRPGTVESLAQFLGVTPRGDHVDPDKVYNRGAGKPLLRGPGAAIQRSAVYQRVIRPLVPLKMRDALRAALLPKARPAPQPSEETVRFIAEQLADDVERLRVIVGSDGPWWELARASGAAD